MRIQTRKATTLTEAQTRTMFRGAEGVREVVVDGVVVGQYARTKHGVTIGHFDPLALVADENPFVAARRSHSVKPASRVHGRTTKDLVADIARQPVGEYEAEIAAMVQRRAA